MFPLLLACVNDLRRGVYWIWNGVWKEAHEVEPSVKEMYRLEKEGYELDEE
jgi:hypothetical protein